MFLKNIQLAIMWGFITVNAVTFPASNFGEATTINDTESKIEITLLLEKWSRDFNGKNLQNVCDLFASDVIAIYSGGKDRNYNDMCQQFKSIFSNTAETPKYDVPEIEEIIISDNLAVVRLIWTLKIYDQNQKLIETIREKGLDIFRRQPEGNWKISISYAFSIKTDEK